MSLVLWVKPSPMEPKKMHCPFFFPLPFIVVRTIPKMEQYCSMFQNFDTFKTPHDALFLVFGVPNAKYLVFGTPDGDALISSFLRMISTHSFILFSIKTHHHIE